METPTINRIYINRCTPTVLFWKPHSFSTVVSQQWHRVLACEIVKYSKVAVAQGTCVSYNKAAVHEVLAYHTATQQYIGCVRIMRRDWSSMRCKCVQADASLAKQQNTCHMVFAYTVVRPYRLLAYGRASVVLVHALCYSKTIEACLLMGGPLWYLSTAYAIVRRQWQEAWLLCHSMAAVENAWLLCYSMAAVAEVWLLTGGRRCGTGGGLFKSVPCLTIGAGLLCNPKYKQEWGQPFKSVPCLTIGAGLQPQI